MACLKRCLFEGLAIGLVVFLLSKGRADLRVVLGLVLVVAVTFCLLDTLAPGVGSAARFGTGLGIGYKLVGGSNNQVGGGQESFYSSAPEELNLQPEILREMKTPTSSCETKPLNTTDVAQFVQKSSSQSNTHAPYRLVQGQWAAQDLFAGYSDQVVAANK